MITSPSDLEQTERSPLGAVRVIALTLTFVTGATGLVYEVAWHRYLANFLGSHARAAAIILALFLGGLCLGYRIFGRLTLGYSSQRATFVCGLCEIGIGAWALAFHG